MIVIPIPLTGIIAFLISLEHGSNHDCTTTCAFTLCANNKIVEISNNLINFHTISFY